MLKAAKRKITPYIKYAVISFWRWHPDLNRGIKVLQTSALPLGYATIQSYSSVMLKTKNGADYGARTHHLDLGKVALYQMS